MWCKMTILVSLYEIQRPVVMRHPVLTFSGKIIIDTDNRSKNAFESKSDNILSLLTNDNNFT